MAVTVEDIGEKPKGGTHVQVSLGISGGDDEPLRVLGGITEGLKHIDQTVRFYVAEARKKGHTWEEIGSALGVTRQAAWEKYSNE